MSRLTVSSLLATLAAVALAACGSASSSSSSAPATPVPLNLATCPTSQTVGTALGITAGTPTSLPSLVTDAHLPAGANGLGCYYLSGSNLVVIGMFNHFPETSLGSEELALSAYLKVPINFEVVSGIGDQAASYTFTTPDLQWPAVGALARQGDNHVGIAVAGSPAAPSLSQVEALVSQLLIS